MFSRFCNAYEGVTTPVWPVPHNPVCVVRFHHHVNAAGSRDTMGRRQIARLSAEYKTSFTRKRHVGNRTNGTNATGMNVIFVAMPAPMNNPAKSGKCCESLDSASFKYISTRTEMKSDSAPSRHSG